MCGACSASAVPHRRPTRRRAGRSDAGCGRSGPVADRPPAARRPSSASARRSGPAAATEQLVEGDSSQREHRNGVGPIDRVVRSASCRSTSACRVAAADHHARLVGEIVADPHVVLLHERHCAGLTASATAAVIDHCAKTIIGRAIRVRQEAVFGGQSRSSTGGSETADGPESLGFRA